MTSKVYFQELSSQPMMAQLQQLTCLTQDGDLIDKTMRRELIKKGYAKRIRGGWNLITESGVECLMTLGFINP